MKFGGRTLKRQALKYESWMGRMLFEFLLPLQAWGNNAEGQGDRPLWHHRRESGDCMH